MKKFEFLISESFGTTFTIEAETKGKAKKYFLSHGYDEKSDDQVHREKFIDYQFCEIEEIKE